MDILGIVQNFIVNGVVQNLIIGGVGTFGIYKVVNYVYDNWFKKIELDAVKFMKEKAYQTGVNTGSFITKKIPDKTLSGKLINDLINNSEEIQNEFVRGLKGF